MSCPGVQTSVSAQIQQRAPSSDAEIDSACVRVCAYVRARVNEPGVERIPAIGFSSSLFFLRKLMLREACLLLKSQ